MVFTLGGVATYTLAGLRVPLIGAKSLELLGGVATYTLAGLRVPLIRSKSLELFTRDTYTQCRASRS